MPKHLAEVSRSHPVERVRCRLLRVEKPRLWSIIEQNQGEDVRFFGGQLVRVIHKLGSFVTSLFVLFIHVL